MLNFYAHGSHIAIQTIKEENKLGINLLTLPAHTTHKLQPLNMSVFGSFKSYFMSKGETWMEKDPWIELKMFELAELASKSFKSISRPQISKLDLGRI